MRSRLILATMGVVALGVTGCGSSSKSTSTAAPGTSGGTATTPGGANVQGRTYNVKLAGKNEVPAGAPSGSASAVISIRGKTNQLCWKFSSLKGVLSPLVAHIHKGPAGTAGEIAIPLDGKFSTSGCTKAAPSLLTAVEKSPQGYYVNIHNAKYPGGVVRAQL